MSSGRACLVVLALVAASCEGEGWSTERGAPDFSLAAGETQEFRVRACFGERDGAGAVSLGFAVEASVAAAPTDGGSMRLFARIDDAPGVDIGPPGDLHLSKSALESCTTEMVVVFERIDTNPDGEIAVEWTADAFGDPPRGWDLRTDAFTISIAG